MHTPTKTQWQTVIDNLEKVLPQANKFHSLEMGEVRVNTDGYICGSCHCIGGWYAISTLDTSKPMNYRAGTTQMAMDLGFENDTYLKDWADENPDIWGNKHGHLMFLNSMAYAYAYAVTLTAVVEHLKGVRDRSPD